MSRRKVTGRSRIINWDKNAHTVVRGSREPYNLGPIYKSDMVDQSSNKADLKNYKVIGHDKANQIKNKAREKRVEMSNGKLYV